MRAKSMTWPDFGTRNPILRRSKIVGSTVPATNLPHMLFRAGLDSKSERTKMDDSPSHENPARIAGNRPRSEPKREFLEWKSGVTAETRIAENCCKTVHAARSTTGNHVVQLSN
jgi:hypothetical protein